MGGGGGGGGVCVCVCVLALSEMERPLEAPSGNPTPLHATISP